MSADRAKRRKITCKACRQLGENRGHGWCIPCYGRWVYHGRPEGGPPPATEPVPPPYKPRPIPAVCRMKRHELVGDNLVRTAEGGWRCRACHEAGLATATERQSAARREQWDEIHAGHDVIVKRDNRRLCRTCVRGDADIDEIAIVRAERGDPPSRLTIAEREAAITHLRSYNLAYRVIAERVGCSLRTAWIVCNRLGVTDPASARALFRKAA
ncbi:hypothetical protein FHR32_005095 [Streptosporangium album]|uniref:Uncharacterized protein n=1 Tax=Streptosporangium album TaxID=47479 RepID=A0A7W7S000_9ACTN|nr:hypothetical protein [Streptosporangium album]MBB4940718.1 hypothetical protein [Streptosporangium album]